jgi:glycosyltransferase involved in cell wall biosynthesis
MYGNVDLDGWRVEPVALKAGGATIKHLGPDDSPILTGLNADRMGKTSLSVLVPVYNEEALVAESLRRLLVLAGCSSLAKIQVIIVNDGSRDNTAAAVRKFLHEVAALTQPGTFEWIFLHHETNLGKGNAVQTALSRATGEISVIHDADLEYHPRDMIKMIPLFIEEKADAVFGSRFAAAEFRRVLMFRHELGNKLITFLCNWVSNLNLTDVETCYKAVRTDLLKSIPLESNDFRIEPELAIKLAKRKAKIFEVPIRYSGRTYYEGKKINWKDGVKALGAIVRFGYSDNIFTTEPLESQVLLSMSRARNFNHWMSETITPYIGGNVLEIGAGIGNITRELMCGKRYYASDINPFYLEMLEKWKASQPGLSITLLDLNRVHEFAAGSMQFDTIICLNVIEHLEDDQRAMRNMASLLAPNGRAIILVPRGRWLFGSQDAILGHKRRYSMKSLQELGSQAGLTMLRLIGFNRISAVPWFINGRILRKKTFSRFQMAILNLLVPFIKRFDPYLPFPSLSLVGVFEKKQATAHRQIQELPQ